MGEVALITGASRGIGRAAAERFLARGARVLSVCRSPCPTAGVTSILADLSDPAGLQVLLGVLDGEIPEAGRLTIIHNAAAYGPDGAGSVEAGRMQAALAVAVVAPAVLNRHLLGRMLPGSAILFLGSTLSEKAVPGALSYVVSKHAVAGLMRATCQDLLGTGVHTACVCPGFTDTEMLRHHVGDDPAVIRDIVSMTGADRLITPGEIASLLEYAADHPVLNGSILHANYGQRQR